MEFQLPIFISAPDRLLSYGEHILLTGSCFSEHIGERLKRLKFNVLQSPNGNLFDPLSVAGSLVSYIHPSRYDDSDLFYLDELWRSWRHHSIFSGMDKNLVLDRINQSQEEARAFLKKTNWLIITLGSAFFYSLTAEVPQDLSSRPLAPVANCHRAPASWFSKRLLRIEEINAAFDNCLHQLFQFNPGMQIIFTVSPVRHIRDGVIENNRSKARLLEAVHQLVEKFEGLYYFPAYELVIDVLHDYRFYDLDMVHPNHQATTFVFEKFVRHFIDKGSQGIIEEVNKIVIARKHKAFQPFTNAHRQFLKNHFELTEQLKAKYPFLDLEEELAYFREGMQN
jgi:hypothetical protein